MGKPGSWLIKYQIPMFFLLAYLLSWWPAPFIGGRILPYGPAIAGAIIMALTAGRGGLRQYWRRITYWRCAWHWYLSGPAIILAYHSSALAILLLAGVSTTQSPQIPTLAGFIGVLLMGGQWEEPGWSGYALPKLWESFASRRGGLLTAILIMGALRAVWHLPLFIYGQIPWFDILVFEIAFQVIIAWLYFGSGGSVPAVMVFHFFSNLMGAVMVPAYSGTAQTTYTALFMGLATLIAIGLAKFIKPSELSYHPQSAASPLPGGK